MRRNFRDQAESRMNILILYHPATQQLRPVYDFDQEHDQTQIGARIRFEVVVDLPNSVPEADRMLREERKYLVERGVELNQQS